MHIEAYPAQLAVVVAVDTMNRARHIEGRVAVKEPHRS